MKQVSSQVESNKVVYKSSQENYLFSVGDQLMVGDLTLGYMIHLDMILRLVDMQISRQPLRTVVEPGCGTGIVLSIFIIL